MIDVSSLFTPLETEKIEFRNRIVMAPMARNHAPDFIMNDNNAAYYSRRARHGVGLIMTEACFIDHPVANAYKKQPRIFGDDAFAGHQKITEDVHAADGKIFCQLWHMGPERHDGGIPNPELPSISPSGLLIPGVPRGRAMTLQDIQEVQDSYARAAAYAKKAGYDGVEIHGAHGYMIDSFLWEGTNRRTDEYGGAFANRIRFAVEVIEKVRAVVGPDFPISFRTSQWKNSDYEAKTYNTASDLELALRAFVDAGVDILHCSTRRFWEPEFEGSELNLAGWAKKLSGKPTISVGSVNLEGDVNADHDKQQGLLGLSKSHVANNLELLVERMNRGEFDMIAVGRALIANPDWAEKAKAGLWDQMKPFNNDLLRELY